MCRGCDSTEIQSESAKLYAVNFREIRETRLKEAEAYVCCRDVLMIASTVSGKSFTFRNDSTSRRLYSISLNMAKQTLFKQFALFIFFFWFR